LRPLEASRFRDIERSPRGTEAVPLFHSLRGTAFPYPLGVSDLVSQRKLSQGFSIGRWGVFRGAGLYGRGERGAQKRCPCCKDAGGIALR
jgi:hypothetical protein